MDLLPNEILKIIIGFLDKDDLLTTRLLNKTWQIFAEDQLRTKYFSLKEDKDILKLIRITSWRNMNNNLLTPFSRFELNTKLYRNNILEKLASVYGSIIQGLIFKKVSSLGAFSEEQRSLNKMFQLLMNTPNLEEVYFWNRPYDSLINEYKLHLPKLRFIEFLRMDTDLHFIQPILNAAPNVQEVQMEIKEKWQDCVPIFQSMATRGIKLKLKIIISYCGISLQNFKELTEIPIKVTDLTLMVSKDDFNMTDLSPIQDFIQKHSKELKYLNIRCTMKEKDKKPLTLDLKNMDILESLELDGIDYDRYGVKRYLEVNLEQAPLLKKLKIKLGTKLSFGPVPLLTSLTIQSDTVCEYLNTLRIRLIEENIRLQKLNLMCSDNYVVGMKEEELIARHQQLNSFLSSQANNLWELKFSGMSLSGMKNLQFPRMVNLMKLKLRSKYEQDEAKKIQLQHSQFPCLEFLSLDTSLYSTPCSVETLENVHTLILLGWGSCLDFEKAGLRFPKLKKLHIVKMRHKTGEKLLPFIFKNMTNVEELYIEDGFSWKELTGIPEIVNFLGETATKSNNLETSISSISNLGDMNALQNLKLEGYKKLNDLKAVPYLISCGKLSNLKYFEFSVRRKHQKSIFPFFEIIEANNTKTKIHLTDWA